MVEGKTEPKRPVKAEPGKVSLGRQALSENSEARKAKNLVHQTAQLNAVP